MLQEQLKQFFCFSHRLRNEKLNLLLIRSVSTFVADSIRQEEKRPKIFRTYFASPTLLERIWNIVLNNGTIFSIPVQFGFICFHQDFFVRKYANFVW